MFDTTTPQDLAKKIEWVGMRNLSRREKLFVEENLDEVSRYLPRLLAVVVWKSFGMKTPDELETRPPESSVDSFLQRARGRRFIREIMQDYELQG